MGNDEYLEAMKPAPRRIVGLMIVPMRKSDAIAEFIHERYGKDGFGVHIHWQFDASPNNPDAAVEVWCDATPEIIEALALRGLGRLMEGAAREVIGAPGIIHDILYEDLEAANQASCAGELKFVCRRIQNREK